MFTLQGVSVRQSVKGFLKCQQCGTLLRIVNFGKYFWYFYVPVLVVFSTLALARKYIFTILRIDPALVWIALVAVIFVTFTFGIWRHAQVEQVEGGAPVG